ncbi:MAG: hypothetical protein DWI10_09165 [Planctomycetota bacterium]|nr:MAG: hypothetical protein DWI10_09165 [Planctomycetota bacterium]
MKVLLALLDEALLMVRFGRYELADAPSILRERGRDAEQPELPELDLLQDARALEALKVQHERHERLD